jgi:hypothetical protein
MRVIGLGLVPTERAAKVSDTGITWNYTTILNIIFLLVAAALVIRFIRSGSAPMLKMMGGSPAGHDQMRGDAEPQPHGHALPVYQKAPGEDVVMMAPWWSPCGQVPKISVGELHERCRKETVPRAWRADQWAVAQHSPVAPWEAQLQVRAEDPRRAARPGRTVYAKRCWWPARRLAWPRACLCVGWHVHAPTESGLGTRNESALQHRYPHPGPPIAAYRSRPRSARSGQLSPCPAYLSGVSECTIA